MILKVKFKANYPSEGIKTVRLVEVIRQGTPDGRDTHAIFEPDTFGDNETLCEGFFLPKTNKGVIPPKLQALLDGMETIELPKNLSTLQPGTFNGCLSLRKVNLPFGLTDIPEMCFLDCPKLEEVSIPDSVSEICRQAFANCRNLVNIQLPDRIKLIPRECFKGCVVLAEVRIPSSVKWIESSAFENCSGLENVYLPDGIEVIGDKCFLGCTALKELNIPDSFRSFTGYTFYSGRTNYSGSVFLDCISLTNIDIPNRVTHIPRDCFKGCSALHNIRIPDSVTEISENAFANCISLIEIRIPDSISEIGEKCFSGCTSLEQIQIPASVMKIGEQIFQNCVKLKKVTLPISMKNDENHLFSDNLLPENLEFRNSSEYAQVGNFLLSKDGEILYKFDGPSEHELLIPRSVNIIKKFAFDGSKHLPKKVILNHTVKIEDNALQSIELVQVLDQVFLQDAETCFRAIQDLEVINDNGEVIG